MSTHLNGAACLWCELAPHLIEQLLEFRPRSCVELGDLYFLPQHDGSLFELLPLFAHVACIAIADIERQFERGSSFAREVPKSVGRAEKKCG